MGYDKRITTYYGDAVMCAGFLPIPHLLMRHYAALDLNADQAMFAMQLMAITWDLAQPPDTMKKLAQRMGVSLRTAQRYSEQLTERGLLIVYEQFQAGAQVENGYDLSPLFRRLATFAPEPRPAGEPRERRVRAGSPSGAFSAEGHHLEGPGQVQGTTSLVTPHDKADTLPPVTKVILSPVNFDAPPDDTNVIPHMTSASGFKGDSKKNHKNKVPRIRQQQDVAAVEIHRHKGSKRALDVDPGPALSLRLGQPLDRGMIARSRDVLARIGVNADVADRAAPALAPEECWALWLHARAARLGPAWVATQIYDRHQRQPRLAGIPRRYDAPGRLLAQLPPLAAEALLDVVEQQWPQELETPWPLPHRPELSLLEDQDALHAALEAIWQALRVEQGQQPARNAAPHLPADCDPRWEAACSRLAALLPSADFQTWIAPIVPIDLTPELTVLGVPNIFVRGEIQATFAEALAGALRAELGYDAPVEIVIDAALGVSA